MRVYIVWMKDKKVTLENLQAECFASISRKGLTWETLAKTTAWHDSSASCMCFSRGYFMGKLLAKHSCNLLILHFMLNSSST